MVLPFGHEEDRSGLDVHALVFDQERRSSLEHVVDLVCIVCGLCGLCGLCGPWSPEGIPYSPHSDWARG